MSKLKDKNALLCTREWVLSCQFYIISGKRVSHASTNRAIPARRHPFFGVNIEGVYSQLFIYENTYSNPPSSSSSLCIVSIAIFS